MILFKKEDQYLMVMRIIIKIYLIEMNFNVIKKCFCYAAGGANNLSSALVMNSGFGFG